MTEHDSVMEPGGAFTGAAPPPAKLDAAEVAYGWIKHLEETCREALADLEPYVAFQDRSRAVARARTRAGAFHLKLDYSGSQAAAGLTAED